MVNILGGLGAAGQVLNYGDDLRRKQELEQLQTMLNKQQLSGMQQTQQQQATKFQQEQQQYQQGQQGEKAAGAAAAGMTTPNNAFGAPDTPYGYSFGAIMKGVKATNPGVDDLTALKAADQMQQMMAPDAKAQLMEEKNKLASEAIRARIDMFDQHERDTDRRFAEREKDAGARLEMQREELDRKKQISDLRAEILQAQTKGMDPKETQKHLDRLEEIDRRAQVSGVKHEASGAKAEVKDLEADLSDVREKIQSLKDNNYGMQPSPKSEQWGEFQKLLKQRDTVQTKLTQARHRLNDTVAKAAALPEEKKPEAPAAEAGASDSAPKAGGYKTADDVFSALDAGKLGKDEAKKILKDQFGYQDQ